MLLRIIRYPNVTEIYFRGKLTSQKVLIRFVYFAFFTLFRLVAEKTCENGRIYRRKERKFKENRWMPFSSWNRSRNRKDNVVFNCLRGIYITFICRKVMTLIGEFPVKLEKIRKKMKEPSRKFRECLFHNEIGVETMRRM